ncbi:MAG: hypothetical protein A3B38_02165 [Candidatus Levybacteria bacterium RIFCSPLOWO2_01_FULL_36_13]|nr:MAG: hypothetical protein A2684_03400 [Candidatus Levybacteria bacterium RIFCSPHIGHO2_01_FULL_36_15b]OGH35668.1 MAG: hypothetical protein A3B38_02165 [Candidatus Levybacteria bacterium RIFCSPLOWO2_01_FULL_36_13]
MNRKLVLIILSAILILAGVLRIWQLGDIPPSPDWDEAALAYNAYSIIQTGKDEYGKFLPVVLRSFDDYKPALYTYLTIPSVLIFGLNTFAVRFPSAIFGIISVIAVYFLVKELLRTSLEIGNWKLEITALISAMLMAISPWSLQFSRVGFEANVGAVLNILTVLFFIKGLQKPKFLMLAASFAAFSIYAYQSEKVFTPLLVLALILIYRKKLFSISKKYLSSSFLLGLLLVFPMVFYIFTNSAALLRVTGTSIFSYQTELLKNNIQRLEEDKARNDKLGLILDNRRIVYAKTMVSGYISHFDPNWLFLKGDIARHHAPNMGMLYLFELPLILIGIYFLLFGKIDVKTKLILFSWVLLAPLPASVTTEVPHAVRTLNFLPTWQIIAALGALNLLIWSKGKDLRKIPYLLFTGAFALLAMFNFMFYLNQYFAQQNYYSSFYWQYGYKEAVDIAMALDTKYDKIIVSDDQPMDKSYMFFLFYLKYPPEQYQKIGQNSAGGYAAHHSFGKYEFRPIDWSSDSKMPNTLLIGNTDEIPSGTEIKTIYNLDGTPVIRVAGT